MRIHIGVTSCPSWLCCVIRRVFLMATPTSGTGPASSDLPGPATSTSDSTRPNPCQHPDLRLPSSGHCPLALLPPSQHLRVQVLPLSTWNISLYWQDRELPMSCQGTLELPNYTAGYFFTSKMALLSQNPKSS